VRQPRFDNASSLAIAVLLTGKPVPRAKEAGLLVKRIRTSITGVDELLSSNSWSWKKIEKKDIIHINDSCAYAL
jgi:hypothetical protein